MKYEDQWAPIHKKVIDQKSINNLSNFERMKYSQFLGFLVVRTVSYREWAMSFAKIALSDAMDDRPSQINKKKNIELFSNISTILPEVILRIKENIDNNPKYSSLNIDFSDILNNLQTEIGLIKEKGIVSERYRVDLKEDHDRIVHELKKMHILKMEELGEIVAKTIYGMVWVLNENETQELFITSDNPVAALPLTEMKNNRCTNMEDALKWAFNVKGKADWYLSDSAPNQSMVIVFPLTPTLILLGGYGTGPCTSESKQKIVDAGLIDVYNTIIVLQAGEYLYGISSEFKNQKSIDIAIQINGIINNMTSSAAE